MNENPNMRHRNREGMSLLEVAFLVTLVMLVLVVVGPSFEHAYTRTALSQSALQLKALEHSALAYGNVHHCLPPSVGPTPSIYPKEGVRASWEEASWKSMGFAPEEVWGRFQLISDVSCDHAEGMNAVPVVPNTRAAVFKVGVDTQHTGQVTFLELTARVENKSNASPSFGSYGILKTKVFNGVVSGP